MATRGRKKRKRKPGARTGVTVRPHTRTPRGPDKSGGKRKPTVRVDPYQRGKPKSTKKRSGTGRRKRRRKKR
jgi:hypothetical protein